VTRRTTLSAIDTVVDMMNRDVVSVRPDDDVDSVLRLLREHELPGVDVLEALAG